MTHTAVSSSPLALALALALPLPHTHRTKNTHRTKKTHISHSSPTPDIFPLLLSFCCCCFCCCCCAPPPPNQVWRDGGYSDDLLLAAYCVHNRHRIGLPASALYPQLLPPSMTFKQ